MGTNKSSEVGTNKSVRGGHQEISQRWAPRNSLKVWAPKNQSEMGAKNQSEMGAKTGQKWESKIS